MGGCISPIASRGAESDREEPESQAARSTVGSNQDSWSHFLSYRFLFLKNLTWNPM